MADGFVYFAKTQCPFCDKFEPEFRAFVEQLRAFPELFPRGFVRKVVYDAKTKNTLPVVRAHGVTSFPSVVFICGGKQLRPAFFSKGDFRTAKVLLFAALCLYYVGQQLSQLEVRDRHSLVVVGHRHRGVCHDRLLSGSDATAAAILAHKQWLAAPAVLYHRVKSEFYPPTALFVAVNLESIRHDLQSDVDKDFTSAHRQLENYPRFRDLVTMVCSLE